MKNLKLFFLLFMLAVGSIAQDIYVPEALSGKFTQTREIKDAGITLKSEGVFSIHKAKGIKWTVEKPFQQTIVINPEAVVEGGEVAKQMASIMGGLLIQDLDALQKFFVVKRTIKGNGFEINLKTTDETIAKIFSEIYIKGRKYVDIAILYNPQGDKTTINFSNLRESAEDF
ncbi:MAG: outer membrane lipoprotein carrier protein LolA [Holophagaceae bacterium]|nr:outer membrane lipoprotein carrier protein LolA [Holophagaceae bacterium]